ncbi:MAG: hypothetical protein V7K27_33165 [Nostoc sp.]|uniref:hypothetical protein n=1 Tax=Nostoc sp. TaxID=1180 RepID=UPI002FFBED9F
MIQISRANANLQPESLNLSQITLGNQQVLTKMSIKASIEHQIIAVQPQQTIKVVDAGHASYPVDVTPVLLEQPFSPFAIALSISIIIGAIVALIKTLKSN